MKHYFFPHQESLLLKFLSDFDISLSQKILEQLYLYTDLILEWNEKTNLISKNDTQKFISRHITDSLIPFIMLKKESKLLNNLKWADMGSGAGCPIIPLSIILPDITFYAVEPRNKRVLFLQEVKNVLALENLNIIGKRFETSGLTNLDIISCRALSSFENDWARAKNSLKQNGLFLTLKSLNNVIHLKNQHDIKIIAICNQKGGVGKTTTAVNLAASFAALEKNTLLIDMDPQGNASQGVGFNEVQNEDIHEALNLAENPDNLNYDIIKEIIKPTNLDFLKIITSGPDLAALEIELVNVMSRERRLEKVVKIVKPYFDFIIIDSPPSLNLLTLNALTAATSVLIPVQCEYYALQGLAELFNTIRLVQKNLNSKLKIEGTLLTMYDARLSLSKQVAEEVRSCISEKVFQSIIPRNVKLSEAPSHGKPVILYDVQSSGAQAYVKLAEEILHGENNG